MSDYEGRRIVDKGDMFRQKMRENRKNDIELVKNKLEELCPGIVSEIEEYIELMKQREEMYLDLNKGGNPELEKKIRDLDEELGKQFQSLQEKIGGDTQVATLFNRLLNHLEEREGLNG